MLFSPEPTLSLLVKLTRVGRDNLSGVKKRKERDCCFVKQLYWGGKKKPADKIDILLPIEPKS